MAFAAHGSAEIESQDQLIIAHIAGPWNLELIRQYQEQMAPFVDALAAQGPWGLIIEISGCALCPPDAIELIRAGAHAQFKQKRRVCSAYVIAPEVEGYRITNKLWRDVYAGTMPFEIFETHAAALHWSRLQLAKANAS